MQVTLFTVRLLSASSVGPNAYPSPQSQGVRVPAATIASARAPIAISNAS
jgi:hypothetical protein